jgi:hypothetical protein
MSLFFSFIEVGFLAMEKCLYKVSPPRSDLMFQPSTFWRSATWDSSTDRYREGYFEEKVLYAGDFDEVNIHIFPRVRTVRVRARDADHETLHRCGQSCEPGKKAYIFCAHSRRIEVESFSPTVFTFNPVGFTNVRNGEYISRQPQMAMASQTYSMAAAIQNWNVQACYIENLDAIITKLTQEKIYFEEQT